jgi:hypothetical protein
VVQQQATKKNPKKIIKNKLKKKKQTHSTEVEII